MNNLTVNTENMFVLGLEGYMIEMLGEHIEDNIIDCENNPEHQKVADFYLNKLLTDKNIIKYDDDIVIIKNYTYSEALSAFGQSVFNQEQTKTILAEIIANKHNVDYFDVLGWMDLMPPNRKFETKEDLDKWVNLIVEDIKNEDVEKNLALKMNFCIKCL